MIEANTRPQDSVQAFSSSIAGLLSSRAVLSSVGVGDATASPTAALFLSIFQESVGRIATILFAHRLGTAFEPECKMYRLLADILNDIAFVLDCLSPVLPKPLRIAVLSFSSVLRALCGVAAGSAKASLSAHFARWGNLGELNAKDSSQETVISLLGMLVGTLVVSRISTPTATWTTLIILLAVHLETNRRAVRAVVMKTLNRQRATLVYHHLKQGKVPTPETIANEEIIFERDGVLRHADGRLLGHCVVGASMSQLLSGIAQETARTGSSKVDTNTLSQLLHLFRHEKYLLWYTVTGRRVHVIIIIKKDAVVADIITAWWQALAVAEEVAKPGAETDRLDLLQRSIKTAVTCRSTYEDGLRLEGWDLTTSALETTSNTRVKME